MSESPVVELAHAAVGRINARGKRWTGWAAFIGYLLFSLSLPLLDKLNPLHPLGGALFSAGMLLVFLCFPLWLTLGNTMFRSGKVRAGPEGLTATGIFGTRTYGREEFVDGVVTHSVNGVAVELEERSGNALSVQCPNEDSAKKLLTALQLDPAHRRFQTTLPAGWRHVLQGIGSTFLLYIPAAALLGTVLSKGHIQEFATVGTLVLSMLVGAIFTRRIAAEITVGVDGVLVQQGVGPSVFLRYSELAKVERVAPGLVFHRVDGTTVVVYSQRAKEVQLDAVLGRIEEARKVTGASFEAARVGQLERNGRSMKGWVEHLQSLLRGEGYRGLTLQANDLRKVLEDPSAPAAQRLGAALALGLQGDPKEPERVRVAVENCADEKLRAALVLAVEQKLDERTAAEVLGETARS